MEMKTFKVEIKETLSRIIEINATSIDEAVSKVKEMYRKEEVVLSWNDFVTTEIDDYVE